MASILTGPEPHWKCMGGVSEAVEGCKAKNSSQHCGYSKKDGMS
jgi:hypothetical protein